MSFVEENIAFFTEERLNKCLLYIETVESSSDQKCNLFVSSIEEFYDKPELIDPVLHELCKKLIDPIKEVVLDRQGAEPDRRVEGLVKMLNCLVRVRGRKVCSRFFPQHVMDLSMLIRRLETSSSPFFSLWETRYLMFVWVSVLLLSPFDVAALEDEDQPDQPLADRVILLCKRLLSDPSKVRDAAAQSLSQLVVRPDMAEARLSTLDWAVTRLHDDDLKATLVSGLLQFLCRSLKRGQRTEIKQALEQKSLVNRILQLAEQSQQTQRKEFSKQWAKLSGRLGLLYLPVKPSSWHNRQQYKSLMNLPEPATEDPPLDDEGDDVDEIVEQVIDLLIRLLESRDSSTRWCASKSLADVTARLPRQFGEELVDTVLQLVPGETVDAAADIYLCHGQMLSLAEFAMRGLIPYPLMDPFVGQCCRLVTVERQTHTDRSVCVAVRDAACYAAWALAHCYPAPAILPQTHRLLLPLLCCTLFDREVNCRRAAAAAMQEHVGRQGAQVQHGIQLVTRANFFSLAHRQTAFTDVAQAVSELDPTYRLRLCQFLLRQKLYHWDPAVRALALSAAVRLLPCDQVDVDGQLFTETMDRATHSFSPDHVHGALLCLQALIPYALTRAGAGAGNVCARVLDVVSSLNGSGSGSGSGSGAVDELVRVASVQLVTRLLESVPDHVVDQTVYRRVFQFVNQCLAEASRPTHVHGARLFSLLCQSAMAGDPANQREIDAYTVKWLSAIDEGDNDNDNDNVNVNGDSSSRGGTRATCTDLYAHGCVCALAVCVQLGRPHADRIVSVFAQCVRRPARWSMETKQVSLEQLTSAVLHRDCRLSVQSIHTLFDMMYACLLDYTTDSRGDVGSWLRFTAAQSITRLMDGQTQSISPTSLSSSFLTRLKQKLVSLALEKMYNIRKVSLSCLKQILCFVGEPDSSILWTLFPERQQQLKSNVDATNTDKISDNNKEKEEQDKVSDNNKEEEQESKVVLVLRLSAHEDWVDAVLDGLSMSLGALSKTVVDEVAEPFIQFLNGLDTDHGLTLIARAFLRLFSGSVSTGRRLSSVLRSLVVLLTANVFDDLTDPTFSLKLVELTGKAMSKAKSNVQVAKLCANIFALSLSLYDLGDDDDDDDSDDRNFDRSKTFTFMAVRQLLLLLGCPYPVVRKYASEQLYSSILLSTPDLCHRLHLTSESLESVKQTLSAASWDACATSEARDERNKLCKLLEFPVPQKIVK